MSEIKSNNILSPMDSVIVNSGENQSTIPEKLSKERKGIERTVYPVGKINKKSLWMSLFLLCFQANYVYCFEQQTLRIFRNFVITSFLLK